MSRIPYPAAGAALAGPDGRPVLNVVRMMEHLPPGVLEPFKALGQAVLWKGTVDPALREMAIVRVGYLLEAAYEVHHHAAFARAVGVTEQQLAELSRRGELPSLDPCQRAAIALVDELVIGGQPTEATLAGVSQFLDDQQLIELVVAVGYYRLVCNFLAVTGIEVEEFTLGTAGPGSVST